MAKKRRMSEDPKIRATSARFYADALAELRRVYREGAANGLTKADIARILGVHRSTVTKMLSGERGNITLGTVGALAGAMDHYPTIRLEPYRDGAGNRDAMQGKGFEPVVLAPASAFTIARTADGVDEETPVSTAHSAVWVMVGSDAP